MKDKHKEPLAENMGFGNKVVIRRKECEVRVRDYGRVDVRLDERGCVYVIDVNPNCDLSEDGGFGRAAARAGLDYEAFLWEILRSALRRRSDSAVLFASRGRSPRHRPAQRSASSSSPRASEAP